MYEHGFATLFLAEVYGMSPRDDMRDKLARAVDLIVRTQNSEGGWRYQPRREDADISVTICQVMALRAARNAGLKVPNETVDKCVDYVKRSQNADGGFRYMLTPGESLFPRSAAGVVALYSAGVYEGREVERGLAYVDQFLPRGWRNCRPGAGWAFLLWALLRRAGDVAGRRRAVEAVVSGDSRFAGESAAAGRIVGGPGWIGIRHGDGGDYFADAG